MRVFGDGAERSIRYEMGDTVVCELQAIVRDVETEFQPDDDGDLIKRTIRSIVISSEPGLPWRGVSSVQLRGVFFIKDMTTGVEEPWGIDDTPGRGVMAADSFTVVHLVKLAGVAKSYPNARGIGR